MTREEQKLREIFGENARELHKAKLISIVGNVVTVERLIHKSPGTPLEIFDIIGLPGYGDDDSEADKILDAKNQNSFVKSPKWLDLLEKNDGGIRVK